MSTRMKSLFRNREATRFARAALDRAGTREAVGPALPRQVAPATVSSYQTRTVHPELRDLFVMLLRGIPWEDDVALEGLKVFHALHRCPDTRARPIGELMIQASELGELIDAPVRTLLDRARYLEDHRHVLNSREVRSRELRRASFPEDLEAEAWEAVELASIIRLLDAVHGIDWMALDQTADLVVMS